MPLKMCIKFIENAIKLKKINLFLQNTKNQLFLDNQIDLDKKHQKPILYHLFLSFHQNHILIARLDIKLMPYIRVNTFFWLSIPAVCLEWFVG